MTPEKIKELETDIEDLEQELGEALVEAIDTFAEYANDMYNSNKKSEDDAVPRYLESKHDLLLLIWKTINGME